MGKKARNKLLRKEVEGLPVIMKQSHENHIRKGHELIALGQTEINGQKVNPVGIYVDPLPVSIAINHHRRLKKLVNKYGVDVIPVYKQAVSEIKA